MEEWKEYLLNEEKAVNTIEKYIRDVENFIIFLDKRELTKLECINWKKELLKDHKETSINSMIAALNKYLEWIGKADMKIKQYKIQRAMYREKEREISKEEYVKILKSAKEKKDKRDYLIISIIGSMGIRVSELCYITVKSIQTGIVDIYNKGKSRTLRIPAKLLKAIQEYVKKREIDSGAVFIGKDGKPLHRSTVWSLIKRLAAKSGVDKEKLFPHNLRHFYAVINYQLYHDLGLLASLLGHSSIETTSIYTRKAEDTKTNDRIFEEIGEGGGDIIAIM